MIRPLSFAAFALVLFGCTELSVVPSDLAGLSPTKGVQYGLPYASYDLTVTRRLTKCEADSFEIETTIAVKKEYADLDVNHIYDIDYESLSSWFKTSDFSLERYPNLMIKKFGVKSADQTGAIIVDTVTTIGKIATTIAGVGGGGRAVIPPCKPEIDRLVKRIKILTDRTKDIEADLRKATANYNTLKDVLSLFKPDGAQFAQTLASAREIRRLQARIDTATELATKEMDRVSDVQTVRFPSSGRLLREIVKGPNKEKIAKWFNLTSIDYDAFNVVLQLKDISGYGLKIADPEATELPKEASGKEAKGLRYREPVQGEVSFKTCTKFTDEGTCAANGMKTTQVRVGPVPQLARVRLLPYSNGLFQNNALAAEFSETGVLTSVSYSELAARADVLAQTAGKVAGAVSDSVAATRKAAADARIAALNKETEEIKARIDNRKAKEAFLAPSTVDNTNQQALIDSDTQLKKAQLANYEADLALKAKTQGQ